MQIAQLLPYLDHTNPDCGQALDELLLTYVECLILLHFDHLISSARSLSNHRLYQHHLIDEGLLPKLVVLSANTTNMEVKVWMIFIYYSSVVTITLCIV